MVLDVHYDFRDGERRLVARLIEGEVRIIATGGGAYIDQRTRELLNERAITIWLDAPVDILAERTSRRDTRAQLRNGAGLPGPEPDVALPAKSRTPVMRTV